MMRTNTHMRVARAGYAQQWSCIAMNRTQKQITDENRVGRNTLGRKPKVALAFPVTLAHLYRTLQGIKDYVKTHTEWSLVASTEAAGIGLRSLARWKGDGAIGVLSSAEDRKFLQQIRFPFVSMSIAEHCEDIPLVSADHRQIGLNAGQHLQSCGFTRFAYFGIEHALYSKMRFEGFAEAIAPILPSILVVDEVLEGESTMLDVVDMVTKWLARLDKPIGVFAANDARARTLSFACENLNLAVPDDVAIISVDNNEVMCEFGTPTLSSIPCNRYQIGYDAAELLDKIMSGEQVEHTVKLIKPLSVVVRESTDVGIFTNDYVTEAHRYIRDHMSEQFNAEQLATAIGLSRRRLEQCVKEATGRTPYDFICMMKIDRACKLMQEGSFTVEALAGLTGFRDGRHFREVFNKYTGITPSKYRSHRRAHEREG